MYSLCKSPVDTENAPGLSLADHSAVWSFHAGIFYRQLKISCGKLKFTNGMLCGSSQTLYCIVICNIRENKYFRNCSISLWVNIQ